MDFIDLTPTADLSALLALNNRYEALASHLDTDRLKALIDVAFAALATPDNSGFVVALDQGAPYDNVNFSWFATRHRHFLYIDRIVVDARAQGSGIAAGLYDALFDRARMAGHELVTCEVNIEPPNPRSERFHARLGFSEVGQAKLPGKTVRYLAKVI